MRRSSSHKNANNNQINYRSADKDIIFEWLLDEDSDNYKILMPGYCSNFRLRDKLENEVGAHLEKGRDAGDILRYLQKRLRKFWRVHDRVETFVQSSIADNLATIENMVHSGMTDYHDWQRILSRVTEGVSQRRPDTEEQDVHDILRAAAAAASDGGSDSEDKDRERQKYREQEAKRYYKERANSSDEASSDYWEGEESGSGDSDRVHDDSDQENISDEARSSDGQEQYSQHRKRIGHYSQNEHNKRQKITMHSLSRGYADINKKMQTVEDKKCEIMEREIRLEEKKLELEIKTREIEIGLGIRKRKYLKEEIRNCKNPAERLELLKLYVAA